MELIYCVAGGFLTAGCHAGLRAFTLPPWLLLYDSFQSLLGHLRILTDLRSFDMAAVVL